jgi:hypothetical protein
MHLVSVYLMSVCLMRVSHRHSSQGHGHASYGSRSAKTPTASSRSSEIAPELARRRQPGRTLRMKNSLPSAAKTSFPLHYFRQLTQSESSSCTRLCKNDASYARRAAPSSGQISFPGGNSLREVRKFPLAVRAVKRTKRDLSQTGISPEVKRAADLRTL